MTETRAKRLKAFLKIPALTRSRMIVALVVAVAADALQIPFQAVPVAPEVIDVVAMALTIGLLGFHVLLLPTFVVEFIPLVDMLPTWTGCVVAVIALRKRAQRAEHEISAPPIVDVTPPKPPRALPPP
ncbi:MAG: hypothetical protein EXS35_19275 [Pedosphaera sp.]|nr:hypothetical protein [Pedosphaera sp.]